MNECDAMCIIIKWMISISKNEIFKKDLNTMLSKIQGKKHVEEFDDPRFISRQMGYINLFPFTNGQYIEIAKLLEEK